MSERVNTFPEDLATMCAVASVADNEVSELMPPDEIVQVVLAAEPTPEQMDFYSAWMENRERIWERHARLVEQLPDADGDGLPGWVGQRWAFALHSRWGAGLLSAVEQGEEWLDQHRT